MTPRLATLFRRMSTGPDKTQSVDVGKMGSFRCANGKNMFTKVGLSRAVDELTRLWDVGVFMVPYMQAHCHHRSVYTRLTCRQGFTPEASTS